MKFSCTLHNHIMDLLAKKHIKIDDLAILVYNSQKKYNPKITIEVSRDAVVHVLAKREVQNIILVGLYLDDKSKTDENMDPYLKAFLDEDSSQFQVDETLSTGIPAVFGAIASSNRGYLDKTKPGIIGKVDSKPYNVFLDDLLAGIVAGAESYIANKESIGVYKEME